MDENSFFEAVKLNYKAFEIKNSHLNNVKNDEKIRNVKIRARTNHK